MTTEASTIRINEETKNKLLKLKKVKRESYSDVIDRLIHLTKECINDSKNLKYSDLDADLVSKLKQGINNVKEGKVVSTKDLMDDLYGEDE